MSIFLLTTRFFVLGVGVGVGVGVVVDNLKKKKVKKKDFFLRPSDFGHPLDRKQFVGVASWSCGLR